jgi:hypothetical protein
MEGLSSQMEERPNAKDINLYRGGFGISELGLTANPALPTPLLI